MNCVLVLGRNDKLLTPGAKLLSVNRSCDDFSIIEPDRGKYMHIKMNQSRLMIKGDKSLQTNTIHNIKNIEKHFIVDFINLKEKQIALTLPETTPA